MLLLAGRNNDLALHIGTSVIERPWDIPKGRPVGETNGQHHTSDRSKLLTLRDELDWTWIGSLAPKLMASTLFNCTSAGTNLAILMTYILRAVVHLDKSVYMPTNRNWLSPFQLCPIVLPVRHFSDDGSGENGPGKSLDDIELPEADWDSLSIEEREVYLERAGNKLKAEDEAKAKAEAERKASVPDTAKQDTPSTPAPVKKESYWGKRRTEWKDKYGDDYVVGFHKKQQKTTTSQATGGTSTGQIGISVDMSKSYDADAMSKETFVLEKFYEMFPSTDRNVTYRDIIGYVSASRPFQKLYATWMAEWRTTASQPIWLREHLSPSEYRDVTLANAEISNIISEHTAKISALAEEYKRSRFEVDAVRDQRLDRIVSSNEYAWLLRLEQKDYPLGMIDYINRELPVVGPQFVDPTTNKVGYRSKDEIASMRKIRDEKLRTIHIAFQQWLAKEAKDTGRPMRQILGEIQLNLNFTIFLLRNP